jgi:hypothetical protein
MSLCRLGQGKGAMRNMLTTQIEKEEKVLGKAKAHRLGYSERSVSNVEDLYC